MWINYELFEQLNSFPVSDKKVKDLHWLNVESEWFAIPIIYKKKSICISSKKKSWIETTISYGTCGKKGSNTYLSFTLF